MYNATPNFVQSSGFYRSCCVPIGGETDYSGDTPVVGFVASEKQKMEGGAAHIAETDPLPARAEADS